MLIGYVRVSTVGPDQTTDLQRDALIEAGVDPRHLFEDCVSGSRDDRAALKAALDYLKSGDVLVVWKLDRLGGVCQTSCPPVSCSVSDFSVADFGFWFEPDGSGGLPVAGFA